MLGSSSGEVMACSRMGVLEVRRSGGLWICFRDQATPISDRCGARRGAGEDGLHGFGLAAGKKKLPLTELGESSKWNRYLARAVGVETEQVLGMLHLRR